MGVNPKTPQKLHQQRLKRALDVLYLVVLSLFGPASVQAQAPVVAVWLPLQSGTLDTLGASGKPLDKGTAMAWEFAAGFRLMADSLDLEVVWIDEFSKSVFRINGQTVPGYPALAAELNRAGIRMVVGPMQSSASEQLAQTWKGIVLNPVSRSTSVESKANLWSATPRDQDEAYGMGYGLVDLCTNYQILAYTESSPTAGKPVLKEPQFQAGFAARKNQASPEVSQAFDLPKVPCRVLPAGTTATLLKTVAAHPAGSRLVLVGSAAESPSLEPRTFVQKDAVWSEIETWDYANSDLQQWAGAYSQYWNAEPGRWSYHGMAMAQWVSAQVQSGDWSRPVPLETPFKAFRWYQPEPTSGFANYGVRWARP
jgi:hypothetical protein